MRTYQKSLREDFSGYEAFLMKWEKIGLVWRPDGSRKWALTHATCPTPIIRKNGELRVFVQSRDSENIGRVGFVDLDPSDPMRIIRVAKDPVLDIGRPGTFDDNGVLQTCVINIEGRLVMYYVGFELSRRIRYRLLTGIAVSDDEGESFKRISEVPVLDRRDGERFFRGGPFVYKEKHGSYTMIYVSGDDWININGKEMPVYDLRRISSSDGFNWSNESAVILKHDPQTEHGFGRPYVLQENSAYKLYYSVRKKEPCAYRMGYAESEDGEVWLRKGDDFGLDITLGAWDSESIEYAAPIRLGNKNLVFYNGNDFGGSGFGLARLLGQ
jgi:predicted GH43/DUF377 family glycosyl hydrolase